jgi:dolichol-phosphate mannosyltransferase
VISGRIFIVVPTYNERENISPLVDELIQQSDRLDVCVADDGSPDGTGDAVRAAADRHPGRITLLERSAKKGRGGAVIAAFRQALADPRYDTFFEMDADFSHDPNEVAKFLAELENCDLVIGSRFVAGGQTSDWGWARPVLSVLANKYIWVVAGLPVRDLTSGFRAYRRAVLEATDFDRIRIAGYAVLGEMAYQAWMNGFRLHEIPIHFRNRARDESKLTTQEIYLAFFNFALLRLRYGMRPKRRS